MCMMMRIMDGHVAQMAMVRNSELPRKIKNGCFSKFSTTHGQFRSFVLCFILANLWGSQIAQQFSVCEPVSQPADLADNLLFLAEQTFANLNMANYPPNSNTGAGPWCEPESVNGRKHQASFEEHGGFLWVYHYLYATFLVGVITANGWDPTIRPVIRNLS